jgi:hypothetical protein
MAKYPDYVIRQIQENTGSLGNIPLVFFQIGGASIKTNVPYELTLDKKTS